MVVRTQILVIILVILTACGDTPQLPQLSTDAVILAFGDSLTQGNGARETENYPAVLEKLSGRKVINAGISGEVSEQGLERLPGLLDKYQPQLLILCHGGNDILRKKDINAMGENIRAMIDLARTKNIPVVLMGVPQFGLFLSTAPIYQEIANATGVVYIEDLVSDILSDNSFKSDAVHPNKHGYKKMAEHIYAVLQEAGAI